MKPLALIQLAAASGVFIAGASCAKAWALAPSTWKMVLTLSLYTVGNLLMMLLIRRIGMATAFSVSAVVQLLAVNALALLVFGEKVGFAEGCGLALAVMSVALITLAPRFGD